MSLLPQLRRVAFATSLRLFSCNYNLRRAMKAFAFSKGERLDTKVVETLEAVFKRVQFVIMDLEATGLDEDVGVDFCNFLFLLNLLLSLLSQWTAKIVSWREDKLFLSKLKRLKILCLPFVRLLVFFTCIYAYAKFMYQKERSRSCLIASLP